LETDKRRSQQSRSRREQSVGSESEEGLVIEAGLERWLAIARDAGRNPETRAHCFASDLALAEAVRLWTAIYFAAMTDGKEMNRILFQVEGVNDSIVPDASPKTIRSLQSMMRECSEARTDFIDLRFDARLKDGRQR
jgi:hypothetical protein